MNFADSESAFLALKRRMCAYNQAMRRCLVFLCFLLMLPAAVMAQADATPPASDGPPMIGLDYGLTVTGALGNAAPQTVYAFDGLRGEVVRIALNVTAGDLDPMLAVLDSAGRPLALVDDNGNRRELLLDSLRLPRSDRYAIIVARFGYSLGVTSGGYTLSLNRVGVSSASGSALRYGDTVINEIDDQTPQLYYSFRARRGDIISVRMQRISGTLDAYLQVVNRNALVVADNDEVPGSGSLDAQISNLVIEQDGTYVIIATRFGQAAGSSRGAFFLTLEEALDSGLGNSIAAPLPLLEDAPVEGELTNERFAHYYRFEANANEIVSVDMKRLSGGLDAFLAIATESGTELISNDDTEGSQNAAIADFLIPADGAYYVVATRYARAEGQTQGRYRLTFQRKGNAFEGVPDDIRFIPYGSTITGSIDDATPAILYAFYGQQGESVTAAMNRGDGDLDPVLEILDAAQRVLASNDDSDGSQNARIDRYTLPATGVYYLRAARYSGEGQPATRGSFILVFAQRTD